MPDLEVVHDLLEFDLEQTGGHQGPIPILTSPPEKTWIWSDLHLADRGVLFAFDRPFHDSRADEPPSAPRVEEARTIG